MPEGGEAEPRPERLQLRINRPGAVVASEEHRRGDRRRRPANDRTPHLRQPCHHRARNDTVQKDVTQGLASAIAGRVRAGTLLQQNHGAGCSQ